MSKKRFGGIGTRCSTRGKIFLDRDLNEHAGEARQLSGGHGGFGFGGLNEEGQTILDFTMAYDFRIMIKKHEEH